MSLQTMRVTFWKNKSISGNTSADQYADIVWTTHNDVNVIKLQVNSLVQQCCLRIVHEYAMTAAFSVSLAF